MLRAYARHQRDKSREGPQNHRNEFTALRAHFLSELSEPLQEPLQAKTRFWRVLALNLISQKKPIICEPALGQYAPTLEFARRLVLNFANN